MRMIKVLLTLLVAFIVILCMNMNGDKTMADLILINGNLFTCDTNNPWAQACAVRDGKILAVGNSEAIHAFQNNGTKIIDLNGRLVVPGFNDAHVHFTDGGFYLLGIDLRDAKDETEFAKKIEDFTHTLKKDEWILGGNWDHEAWPSKDFPEKELIDEVTRDNPVFVQRLDGHVALANSLALKLADITNDTPDPQGGKIEKDPQTGGPTGILKDTAQDLVSAVVPQKSKSQMKAAIKAAMRHANEFGVTSIQDNSSREVLQVYQELLREGDLAVRVNAWMPIDHREDFDEIGILPPFGNDMLRLGTMKVFVDGSMGAGTALFYQPYADDPETSGLPIYPEDELVAMIKEADKAKLQIAAHAIGDKANTLILDAFDKAFKENGRRNARHRVEHAQVVLPDDVQRFKKLGIIASIQPSHCIDDMRWAKNRIGDRIKHAYLFDAFNKAGVNMAFGTDWTVEPLNPMLGLYAAVTREFPEGGPEGGWFPEEKISLEEAIVFYTMGSAYAEFQEHCKGSIEAGKLADLVVLEKNLFEISPEEILNTKVDLTILGGKIVFERK